MTLSSRIVRKRNHYAQLLEGYLRGRLLPSLGLDKRPFRLSQPPAGAKSVVLFLEPQGSRPLVIRCPRSYWEARAILMASDYLKKRGLLVSNIIYADLSLRSRMKLGSFVMAEDKIEGQHLFEAQEPEALLPRIARALAMLHSHQRQRWGSLLWGRKRGFFPYLLQRIEKHLHSLPISSEETDAMRSYFKGWQDVVEPRNGFQLCHMRINQGNIIVTPQGDVYFLDLSNLSYMDSSLDLIRALHRFCQEEEKKVNLFLETYFTHLGEAHKSHYEATRAFYDAAFHVSRANRSAKRLQEGRVGDYPPDHFEGLLEENLQKLRAIIFGGSAPKPLLGGTFPPRPPDSGFSSD